MADDLWAPVKSKGSDLWAPVAVPESTRVAIEQNAKARVQQSNAKKSEAEQAKKRKPLPKGMTPLQGGMAEVEEQARRFTRTLAPVTRLHPYFRPEESGPFTGRELAGEREPGGQLVDLADSPVLGTAANFAENLFQNERIANTPQDVATPGWDEVGNLTAAVAQAVATGGPKTPGLLPRLMHGAGLGASMQMRRQGLSDPTGTLTGAAMGLGGAALAPTGRLSSVVPVISDALMGSVESARVDPLLTAKILDGTATPEERQAYMVQQAMNIGPSAAGSIAGAMQPNRFLVPPNLRGNPVEGPVVPRAPLPGLGGRGEIPNIAGPRISPRVTPELAPPVSTPRGRMADLTREVARAEPEWTGPRDEFGQPIPVRYDPVSNDYVPTNRQGWDDEPALDLPDLEADVRRLDGEWPEGPYQPEFGRLPDPLDESYAPTPRDWERDFDPASPREDVPPQQFQNWEQYDIAHRAGLGLEGAPLVHGDDIRTMGTRTQRGPLDLPDPEGVRAGIDDIKARRRAEAEAALAPPRMGILPENGPMFGAPIFDDYLPSPRPEIASELQPGKAKNAQGSKAASKSAPAVSPSVGQMPRFQGLRRGRSNRGYIDPYLAVSIGSFGAIPLVALGAWVGRKLNVHLGRALDSALSKAKGKILRSSAGETAKYFMPHYGAGPEYAQKERVLSGKRTDAAMQRAALDNEFARAFRSPLGNTIADFANLNWRHAFEAGKDVLGDLLSGNLSRPLRGATKQQLDEFYNAMENPTAPINSLTPEQRGVLQAMRAAVSQVQDALIAAKVPRNKLAQLVAQTRGKYFRRFYSIHENGRVWQRIRERTPQRWQKAVDEFLVVGRFPDRAAAEQALVDYLSARQTETEGGRGKTVYGAGHKVPKGPFMGRTLDNMPALREVMGEFRDPVDRFSKTTADLTAMLHRHEFFRTLYGHDDPTTGQRVPALDENGVPFAMDEISPDTGHTKQIEEAPPGYDDILPFGDITGKWVKPEVWAAIDDGYAGGNGFWNKMEGAMNKANGPFYWMKTSASPATQGANLIAMATWNAEMANNSVANPRNYGHYGRALKGMFSPQTALGEFTLPNGTKVPRPSIGEMERAGAFTGSRAKVPVASESLRSWRKIMDQGLPAEEFFTQIFSKFDQLPVVKQLTQAYVGADHWFRAAAVLKNMQMALDDGMPRDAALRRAVEVVSQESFADYGMNAPAAKEFQKTPIAGPFLSYPLDLPRQIFNGFRHNPVKALMMTGIASALASGYQNLFGDDAQKKNKEKAFRLLNEFERADMTAWRVSKDGKLEYLPTSRVFPLASLVSMIRNPSLSQWFLSNPLASALVTAETGTAPYGGERIPDNADWQDTLDVVGSNLGKAYEPGVMTDVRRYQDAKKGIPDPRSGRLTSPEFAAMGFSGFRPRDMHWDYRYRSEAGRVLAATNDWIENANKVIQAANPDPEDIKEQLTKLEKQAEEVERESVELPDALAAGEQMAPKSVSDLYGKNKTDGDRYLKSARSAIRSAINEGYRKLSEVEAPSGVVESGAVAPEVAPVKNVGASGGDLWAPVQ